MSSLRCSNCGYVKSVPVGKTRLTGIGVAAFGVFGWVSFLFAGSGHAFLICCVIFLAGLLMFIYPSSFGKIFSEGQECPRCGLKEWKEVSSWDQSGDNSKPIITVKAKSKLNEVKQILLESKPLRLPPTNETGVTRRIEDLNNSSENSRTKEPCIAPAILSNQSLHETILNNDSKKAKLLIDASADVNARDEVGNTPLHTAVFEGHPDIAKLYIKAGADVTAKNDNGHTPLHTAADVGYLDIDKLLIDLSADVNAKNNFNIVKLLVDAGADVNAKDNDGKTPLHIAASKGHFDVAKMLIDAGADVNAKDFLGHMPWHDAASKGFSNIAKLLVDSGANVNAKNDFDTVKLLVDAGLDVTALNGNGFTLLHNAVSEGRSDIVKLLIAAGVDVNAKDNYLGETPLHTAAHEGHYDITKLLIDACADVNARHDTEKTPLHTAASKGRSDIVKLLIEAGADVNAKNDEYTPLYIAASKGHSDIAKLFVDAGADVNAKIDVGNTPLYIAASKGHSNIAKLLVDAGANVNAKDNDGYTPLLIATNEGHSDIVKLLIDAGVDVNAKDNMGQTPLHVAALYGHSDITKLLIDAGADVNAKDNYESTPLDIALECDEEEIANFLKSAISDDISQTDISDDITNKLKYCVHSWDKLGGKIPYHFFYYYMPKRYVDVSEDSQYARNLIYSFKDGIEFDNNFIYQLVYNELFDCFNDYYNHLTFANIPASTIESNKRRYESFSNDLCYSLSCHNGYHHIHIVQETQPKHQSGDGRVKYELDKDFFASKNVFIFDDVVTTGMSMLRFSDELKKVGANVICALSIGKTYNDAFYSSRPAHPYTGTIC